MCFSCGRKVSVHELSTLSETSSQDKRSNFTCYFERVTDYLIESETNNNVTFHFLSSVHFLDPTLLKKCNREDHAQILPRVAVKIFFSHTAFLRWTMRVSRLPCVSWTVNLPQDTVSQNKTSCPELMPATNSRDNARTWFSINPSRRPTEGETKNLFQVAFSFSTDVSTCLQLCQLPPSHPAPSVQCLVCLKNLKFFKSFVFVGNVLKNNMRTADC